MSRSNQNGFSVVVMIIAVLAALAIIALVGWRLYDASRQQGSQTSGSSSSATQTNQPQADPNEGYVVIKEWGVRFKPVEGLSGVVYFKPSDVTSDSISITTEELGKLEPNCSTKSSSMVLGLLTRSKNPSPEYGGVFTQLGEYSFQYRVSGAACSSPTSDHQVESKTGNLIRQSIKSIEATK